MQPNAKKQLENTKSEISKGIGILKDYVQKMDRAIDMISEKTPGFNIDDLLDSKEKCEEMIAIVVKKEEAVENQKSGTTEKTNTNRYGLTRDEQRILDNWEDQMKEIVK